ncbi:MAG: cytochrome b [Novosphingobium sp.]|nr:cytochrome b [Novosphingobium sp.]
MTEQRYSRVAIALHWAIAALLAFQLGLGWRMVDLGSAGAMYAPFQLHKSIGILVLLLSLARIAVRFVRPRPAAVASGLTGMLAAAVHAGLYVFMIGGPLTGWVLVSTARLSLPTRLFGTVPWPHLPLGNGWHEPAEGLHGLLGWVGAALIVLHVAGALRHHLGAQAQPNVLGRMIPAAGPARAGLGWGIGAAAALAAVFALPWLVYGKAAPVAPAPQPSGSDVSAEVLAVPDASGVAVDPSTPAVAASASALAEEKTGPAGWKVQPGGKLGFRVMVNGEPVDGSFSGWSADIAFDPAEPETGTIVVRIPLLSVASGDDTRDTMLKGEDFFGGGPATAIFRSTAIRRSGAGRYVASGTLAMNGMSRPLNLSFGLKIDGNKARADGSATLDRTTFGVGKGEWAGTDQIAGKVDVTFAFDAKRSD